MTTTRRRYLGLLSGVAVGGLAGCQSGGAAKKTYDAPTVAAPEKAQSYLSNVANFDGKAVDLTGRDRVTVNVGAKGNGGYNAYSPPAIQIAAGTTVEWDWTGKGAPHNVVAENGEFDSGATQGGSGVTFTHTFDSSGIYQYYCTPHRRMGMKGVVIVK